MPLHLLPATLSVAIFSTRLRRRLRPPSSPPPSPSRRWAPPLSLSCKRPEGAPSSAYDWMGVAKSALQSICRYLARDLGEHRIRVNLVSAGPLKTVAAKSIPGFEILHDLWNERAPLSWDSSNPEPVARMVCVLLS